MRAGEPVSIFSLPLNSSKPATSLPGSHTGLSRRKGSSFSIWRVKLFTASGAVQLHMQHYHEADFALDKRTRRGTVVHTIEELLLLVPRQQSRLNM